MFRRFAKLTAFFVAVLAVALFMSASKAYAAQNGCPSPSTFQDAQNNLHWGVTPQYNGSHGGDMAGMLVHAYDAQNGQDIDLTYRVHSGVAPVDPKWGPSSNGSTVNLNNRIFMDIDGSFSNRTNNYLGGTNSLILTSLSGSLAVTCRGWDAFGPADVNDSSSGGNGYVLDCGPLSNPTHFWFSDLSNPTNDGPNGRYGYWSIDVFSPNDTIQINHYTEGMMGYSGLNNYFTVTNGSNTFVNMAWHPTSPPPPTNSAACSKIDWYNYGNFTTVNGAGQTISHPTRTLVETSNPGAINNATGGPISAYAPGSGGSTTKSDQIWDITATASSFTFYTTREYQQTNGNWEYIDNSGNASSTPTRNAQNVDDCYHASCGNVAGQSISVMGPGPNHAVVAGQQFSVTVPVANDNGSGNAETIPASPGGFDFSITEPPDDAQGGFAKHSVGSYLNVGDWTSVTITYTAPGNVRYFNLSYYPDLYGSGGIGNGCSVSVPVYGSFTLEPHATLDYPGTKENPGQITYSTYIRNNSGSAVPAPTTSTFTFTPYSGGAGCPNNGPVNSNGPYAPGGPDYIIGKTNCNPASLTAGDQYCSEIDLTSYNAGYIGPAGDVIGQNTNGPMTDKQCLTIVNEPYFKTFGTGVSAGGDFSTNGSGDCKGGGLLAGYTDNADSPPRGAGSQLSALALIKITGFASAQNSNPTSSPPGAALTFANTNPSDINSSLDSPSLGGNFDPGGSHCLTDQSAGTGATIVSGPYTYPGKTGISDSESVFVNGDVRVTGPITYSGSWTLGHVPSFTLHATGNIYIDPGVTQLDGLYVSDKNIYTCDNNGFSPMPASGMYNGCKNQLVFNGLASAQHIKLQRTFGSLRDEKSVAGSPGGSQIGFVWSSAGAVPGMRCTQINEPSDPDTWYDNYLCVPNSSPLQVAWTHFDNSPYPTPATAPGGDIGMVNASYWTNQGWTCRKWDVPPDYGHTWYDNSLCTNQNVGLSFGGNDPSKYCTSIVESADPDGSWKTGYYLCEPKAAPLVVGGVPAAPPCSNKGSQVITTTCAAEVFNFSPELYLSTPVIQLPNNGAVQYDSVTSLPPVL